MRILQVNSAQNLGGGETHVIELKKKLTELGHHVWVAGRETGPLNPDISMPFRNSADFFSSLRLRRILRSEKIDVVHAHVARDYTVVAAAAFSLRDVAVVFTRHLLYPIKRQAFYRRVDGWLAPTKEILNTLSPLKPRDAAVIPNWIDPAKFLFDPHDMHSPVTVGLLGQIAPHKGPEDAIECMRILGPKFRLLVGGDGDPRYLQKLKQRSAGLPIDFLGFVSARDFFRVIDILVVPSWHEPFGIVLLEAMASGVPVVSANCGGPSEIIRSGEDGLLVSPREPLQLAAAVRQLADTPSQRSSFAQQARSRVEFEYDINLIVPRIEQFYSEIHNKRLGV
jgi:glycosyltransferase involved in cell wall biosynthesis